MSRTIEAIIAHTSPPKRSAIPAQRRLTAHWQNGLESGGQVQRKLRLSLSSGPLLQRAS